MADRDTSSARNVVYVIGKQFFWLLLNFAVKTVFVDVMGKEYLGLNGIFNNIFLLFSFAEFGLGTSMLYSFYEPFARKDRAKCAALYGYYRKLYIKMSFLMLGLGILLIPVLPFIVDIQMPLEQIAWFYLLYIGSSCVSNLYIYKSYVLTADQNQYLVSRIQTVLESICFIVQIAVILGTKSFTAYLLCILAKFVLMGGWYSYELKNKYPYVCEGSYLLDKAQKHVIFQNTKDLFIYKFSKVMINSTDNVIISIMVGTIWVGMYSNYEFVVMGVWGFVTAFFSALSASVGNLVVEQDKEKQYKVYRMVEMMNVWIAGFVAVCLMVLFQDFILLWIGEDYQLGMEIVALIVLNIYLRSMRECTGMFREAAGLFGRFKNITAVTAAMNIILSFLWGHFWGMAGIFAATAVSVLLTYFWYEPYLIHKELFKIPVTGYFLRQFKNIGLTVMITCITYGVCSLFQTISIPVFVCKILICLVLPNLFFLGLFGRKEEFKTVWKKVCKMIRGKRG